MNGKIKFLNEMKVSWLRKFIIRRVLCQEKNFRHKLLGGIWPEVTDAPDPSLIEWKNIGASGCNQFLRQVFVYLLVFIFVAAYFTGLVYTVNYSNDL